MFDTVISVSLDKISIIIANMKFLIVFCFIAFACAKPQQIGFQYLDEAIRQAQSEQNFESDAVVIDVSYYCLCWMDC